MNKRIGDLASRRRFRSAPNRPERTVPVRQRRVSRREQEDRRRRQLYWGLGLAAALVVLILAIGVAYDYAIEPRQELARVGDTEIRRRDYWRVRALDLVEQERQFSRLATLLQGEQQMQYLQLAAQADAELDEIWGTSEVNTSTLNRIVEDQVYLQSLDDLGLTLTDEDIEAFILEQFGPADAPALASPVAAASPVIGPEEAEATAEAAYARFQENVLTEAGLSREEYVRLVARPGAARLKVEAALAAEIDETAEQVHAAHILVGTEDLAEDIREQLAEGANFEELAREQSIDPATAATGGDLGWFTRAEMVEPFADVAFDLEAGDISEPFQTEFGWHIVKVYERDDERPLTEEQRARLEQEAIQEWLAERMAELEVTGVLEPTPTPAVQQFQPPAGAPLPPTPTPLPATPVADGTPVATPQA